MQVQGAGRAKGDMNLEDRARLNFANHRGAALLDGLQVALQNVACAQADRPFERKQNIARANGDSHGVTRFAEAEWDFNDGGRAVETDAHDPIFETDVLNGARKQIFKS